MVMRTQVTKRGLWLVLLLALGAGPASAACITPPLAPELINQFKSNPQGLIPTRDTDTRAVEGTTRDLAGTDSALAPDLVKVAEGALPRFQAAIAAGLAQAALACLGVDQKAALQIQQAVANFQDGQFQALFAAVVGDLSTAATVAAESAATTSVGSVIITNRNSAPGTKTTPGGGGTLTPIPVASTGVFGVTDRTSPNTVGSTSSSPVSATR
jgi:hypothetical protein